MRAVSRFEANLLQVLRVLVQQAPKEQAARILARPTPRPPCLSRDAVELIKATLAKGCVPYLARRGWMRERFLRGMTIASGRLWERTPPADLGLTFSIHALEFLVQLVSGSLGTSVPKIEETTVGDRLLLFLALDSLRRTEPGEQLPNKWPLLHQDGLCRLAFLEELAEGSHRYRVDWTVWITGVGASILETLQADLAERWSRLERAKENIAAVARMRKLGLTQTRVYGEYLEAIDLVQRRDLARCFLVTARRLFAGEPSARRWIHALDLRGERLAKRREIYQDALAFVRQLERLQTWQHEASQVGYFDEGYQASQLWKADWERAPGDRLCEHACTLLREVEPM